MNQQLVDPELALWLLDGPSVATFGLTAAHLPRRWPWEQESLHHQFVVFAEDTDLDHAALWRLVDRLSKDRLNWRIYPKKSLEQVAQESLTWRQCAPHDAVLVSGNSAQHLAATALGLHWLDCRADCSQAPLRRAG